MRRSCSLTVEGAVTEASQVVFDAMRDLEQHQCARDVFEEFVCAKVVPLWGAEKWFTISEERYKEKGLKCPDINVLAG